MAEPKPTMLDPEDDDFDYKEEPTSESSMEETMTEPEEVYKGVILEGEVVQTQDDHALVDLNWTTEGILPFRELREGSVSVGDKLFVKVTDTEYEGEAPLLSEKDAAADRAWERVRRALDEDAVIEGEIFKQIKGGFLVRLFHYLTAFMPQSHLSLNRESDYDSFLNQTYKMKVLECDRDDDNVVVSRREFLEERRKVEQKKFFAERDVGEWCSGVVKNIVNFGAFIDLGPVDGLLHKSDIAWGSVRDVEDHLSLGDEVEVKILSMEPEEGKVSLGLKQKHPDPWEEIEGTYREGQVTSGEIVDVWSDGVFVRLERDVEGKIPESELAWTQSWDHPEDQFREGEQLDVTILNIDPERRRMTLSAKAAEKNPWDILEKRFPEGTVVSAPVVDVKQDFINVQLLKNVKGIIRRSNIRWEKDNIDLYEQFPIGEKVKCKVLELDPGEQRVELGIKQTLPDPWVKKARKYPAGTTLEGTVTNVLQFGAFVKLEEGLEGLVHVSEMAESKRVNPFEEVQEGDEVGVKVLSIDEDEHKIDLSIQGYRAEEQRKDVEEFMKSENGPSADNDVTFGEVLGEDLKNIMRD